PVSVPFAPTASSFCGFSNVTVVCTPASPGPFPVGTTPVVCVATDGTNTAQCTFPVVVSVASPGPITPSVSNGVIVLNWSGIGNLQSADTVNGPYIDIDPTPVPPYQITPDIHVKQKFFRVRNGGPGFTFYDTELLALDIVGGNLPPGMRLR